MAKLQSGIAVASPVLPTLNRWARVKQGFRGLVQEPVAQSDDVLTATLLHALGAVHLLGQGDLAHLHLTVNQGVATLTGHVVRSSDKAQAAALASKTPGVCAVVNQLVVDSELMIEVAQTLGHDQQTQAEQIQVNVQHGVVYLGGTVNQAAVRAAAAQIAARIPQGRGIINAIKTPGFVIDPDEERFVQPQIEHEIYATDGLVGRIQQVVINPQTRRVTAVVIRPQLAVAQALTWAQVPTERLPSQRPILIPIGRLRCALSGALFLTVSGNTATHFVDFNAYRFAAPPADWQPPFPYRSADLLFAGAQ